MKYILYISSHFCVFKKYAREKEHWHKNYNALPEVQCEKQYYYNNIV